MSLMNLFNGGGSVGSRPSASPGPKTRQKLQPRSAGAILNSQQNKQNRNQRRWEGFGGKGPYPVLNQPNPWDRRHSLHEMSPGWLEASSPRNNTGVMAAMAGNPMVNKAKDFYNIFDPWIPNMDIGDSTVGYEFEKPILGGTLGYGFDYDWDDENVGAFFNWTKGLGG